MGRLGQESRSPAIWHSRPRTDERASERARVRVAVVPLCAARGDDIIDAHVELARDPVQAGPGGGGELEEARRGEVKCGWMGRIQ